MSEPKSKKNPTYALDTLLWVKLLNRVWWPGTVVDPLTIPQELLLYVKKVEPIACVVKFKEDDKYHVVGLYEEVYLYSCDRKMEFIEKGFSLYKNQLKGFAVIGKFDMNNFKNEVISMERLIGGDICIFENLKEQKEIVKSIVKEFFTPTNTKKSKKKEVERKSLPAPKLPKTLKTPNQPKPKPVSNPRSSTQSQVGKKSTGYTCHSKVGCSYTTNRFDNLKWHMATHKNDTDVVTTKKSSNSSTPNKRKNVKTKSSEVKKQKLQEELLKDWDNDGEDDNEEINTSGVQSSSNVAQSSNEEVLQTLIDVQSSNEEIVQTKSDVLSSSNVVQSSSEEIIPTSKVLSSKNDAIPITSKAISRNSEVQETSTCSPTKVFDFNENDNNSVVELRQSKSDCSSTVDDDISETFESQITPDFINNTIFEASPSESVLVEKPTENVIDKPHGIQSNELASEIDNQTKSTELLLEKSVNTLDQINNFENSLSGISSSINNSDANILTEDNNVVVGESESECGSLNKTTCLNKGINIETIGLDIPLVENMSTETEDSAIVEENTSDKEIVSNDEEVNQLNGTTIDKNMPIENSCSVDSTSNKIDCEDKIIEKEEFLDVISKDWFEGPEWESTRSATKANSYSAELKLPTSHKCTLPEFLK
ncbi:uncharacterized protein LOC132951301 isoform X2 [Metopolophium dirhodum]|uniref:uncharacterized protein LOC132951301 isoform X2 n=1 Tax=Metopolophium dirhodum TaxID=44670 RepID=UPI0029907D10|nr:uncharacterized protein LOC132951301 isoform X2 [Metopolophium dirhodum]